MPAKLVALDDGPSILLDKPIVLLGRNAECDIQMNSRKISRRHCCIARVRDYLVIRDLGSTNGVRINGVRVAEGRLQTGDELMIGNFRYQVSISDSIAGAATRDSQHSNRLSSPSDEGGSPSDSSDEPIPLEPHSSHAPGDLFPKQINLRSDSKL